MGQLTKPAFLQCFSKLLHCHVKSVLMASAHFYLLFLRQTKNLLCLLHAHGHRLFNNHMNSLFYTKKSNLPMESALGCNTYQLWFYLCNHSSVIGKPLNGCIFQKIVLFQKSLHTIRNYIADSHNLQAIFESRLNMICRNPSTPNQCVFHNPHSCYFSFIVIMRKYTQ